MARSETGLFILWGTYHGLFLVLDKLFWLRLSAYLPRQINMALTFLFVMLGWVIFRSTSLEQMHCFFSALFNPTLEGTPLCITDNVWCAIMIGLLISFVPATKTYKFALKTWGSLRNSLIIENWALSTLSLLAISRVVTLTFNPFLYFRF